MSLARLAPAFSVAAGLLVASGCEWVPDQVNPVRWFRDDDKNAASAEASGEEFPNLATVPDKPRPASSPEELEEITEGLIADRQKAAYTDEFLRNNPGEEVDFSAATLKPSAAAEAPEAPAADAAEAAATEALVEAAPAPEVTIEPVPAQEAAVTEDAAPPPPAEEPMEAVAAETETAAADSTATAGSGEAIAPPLSTDIIFAAGSASLDDKAQATLQGIAKVAAEQQGTFRILTWAGGPEGEDAGELAEQRAVAVAEGLLALGVSGQRLSALVMKGPDPDAEKLDPSTGRATITHRK